MTIPVQHDDDDFYINTTLADAQATIAALTQENERLKRGQAIDIKNNNDYREQVAALQAQLNEQSEKLKYHDLFKKWQCWRDPDELVDEYEKWQAAIQEHQSLKDQLTQRTAELEAANIRADKAVQDRADVLNVKSTDGLTSSEWIMRTATAERKVKDLQAELERVRGLVRALPAYKDISVSHRIDENDYESWHVWVDHNPLAECDTEEEANAIKALYEHRQGMEG